MKFNQEFRKAARAANAEPSPGPLLEGHLKDEGFEDVVAQKYVWPVGTWPAERHLVSRILPCHEFILSCIHPDLANLHRAERSGRVELPANHGGSRRLYIRALHAAAGLHPEGGRGHLRQHPQGDEGPQDARHVSSVRSFRPPPPFFFFFRAGPDRRSRYVVYGKNPTAKTA